MCEPFKEDKNLVRCALSELVSAISSLNMEPDPIEKPDGIYLSDVDYFVKHSVEHIRQAIRYLEKLRTREEL